VPHPSRSLALLSLNQIPVAIVTPKSRPTKALVKPSCGCSGNTIVADEAFSSTRNIPHSDLLPDDLKTVSAMKMIGWNYQGKGKNLRSSNKMEFLDRLMLSTGAHIHL
jgi:hypothetical protein